MKAVEAHRPHHNTNVPLDVGKRGTLSQAKCSLDALVACTLLGRGNNDVTDAERDATGFQNASICLTAQNDLKEWDKISTAAPSAC